MFPCYTDQPTEKAIPIFPILEGDFVQWHASQEDRIKKWVEQTHFVAKSGAILLYPGVTGELEKVFVGIGSLDDWCVFGQLAVTLPQGVYKIHALPEPFSVDFAALAWGLGSYQFTVYKKSSPHKAKLSLDKESINLSYLHAVLQATYWVRDLINTPAQDMMPHHIADQALFLEKTFLAQVAILKGEALLGAGYNSIYTVGRGSVHAPHLIDIRWGDKGHPKVTLVGKGVCFDSGGLDLKSAANMGTMKKDMAGAAHVLGLGYVIMSLNLPICLRILIPAVENSVSGASYHPGDIIRTRPGKSVEVTNTDAEGRLILCEALEEAAKEAPELLLDFATLTGAARVALGTDIAALFTDDNQLAVDLMAAGEKEKDPIWHLPLYTAYKKLLDSKVADLSNASSSPYGGAITAALFLKEFIPHTIKWGHFDMMAWNTSGRSLGPEGGEANALRAVIHYLLDCYPTKQ